MELISKKKYAIELIVEIALLLFASFCFLMPSMNRTASKITHNNLVSVANFDFKIPSPSKDQINDIREMSSVDNVYPFFDTFASVQAGRRRIKDTFVLIVPLKYKTEFPLVCDRLLIKGDVASENEMLLVDYSFSAKNKIGVNTKLKISIGNMDKDVLVSGVVNNFNDMLSSPETQRNAILLFLDDETMNLYFGKAIPYSGAYVQCNDVEAFKNYLASYKPYGRMKTRDFFNSEQEYNDYVDYFNAGNYDKEILNLEIRNKLILSNDGIVLAFMFAIVSFTITLILNILIISDKSLVKTSRDLIQNGENYTSVIGGVKKLLFGLLCICLMESVVAIFLFFVNLRDYCPVVSLVPVVSIAVFFPLVLGILSILVLSKNVKKRLGASF